MSRRQSGTTGIDKRWGTVLWLIACLLAACAVPGFLLRHFRLDQVLALASFVFLELLVIRSVSRMEPKGDDSGTFPD